MFCFILKVGNTSHLYMYMILKEGLSQRRAVFKIPLSRHLVNVGDPNENQMPYVAPVHVLQVFVVNSVEYKRTRAQVISALPQIVPLICRV